GSNVLPPVRIAMRGFGAGRAPRSADCADVEALGLEQPRRGGEVLLALADAAAARQRAQEELVHARIERGELEPALEMGGGLVVGRAADQVLEQCGVTGAQAPPLRGQPGIERGVALEFDAL